MKIFKIVLFVITNIVSLTFVVFFVWALQTPLGRDFSEIAIKKAKPIILSPRRPLKAFIGKETTADKAGYFVSDLRDKALEGGTALINTIAYYAGYSALALLICYLIFFFFKK